MTPRDLINVVLAYGAHEYPSPLHRPPPHHPVNQQRVIAIVRHRRSLWRPQISLAHLFVSIKGCAGVRRVHTLYFVLIVSQTHPHTRVHTVQCLRGRVWRSRDGVLWKCTRSSDPRRACSLPM